MSIHPVPLKRLSQSLKPNPQRVPARRGSRLPAVPGNVRSVIGMRRAGKTTYHDQWLEERAAAGKVHRRARHRLLVLDEGSLPRVETPGVLIQPAYRWLLEAPGES